MCDDCPAEPAAEVRVSGLLLPHLQVEIDTFLHTTSVVTASTVGTVQWLVAEVRVSVLLLPHLQVEIDTFLQLVL